MRKLFLPTFSINLARIKTKRETNTNVKSISRRCLAVVIEDDGILKACIEPNEHDNITDKVIIPFTERSFNLKGRTHVYSTKKDKNNRNILCIRDAWTSIHSPGTSEQYVTLKKNALISGKVIKLQNKMYFDYEELIAFNSYCPHINSVRIDNDKAVFK